MFIKHTDKLTFHFLKTSCCKLFLGKVPISGKTLVVHTDWSDFRFCALDHFVESQKL